MAGYTRILLKLSGEMLGGESGQGWDPRRAGRIASEVVELVRSGVQTGIVVGGGNFFRGVDSAGSGLERTTVDSMGMLATAINALAFVDGIRAAGGEALALSAVGMEPLIRRYNRADAMAALEDGRVVVFAGGTGNPYFSTDSAAALRAIEIGAELLAKATKVDGVYDKDPAVHSDAKHYAKISYAEVLEKQLGVMDLTAVALCRENAMPVLVFNLNSPGAIARAAAGEDVGTLMR